MIVIDSALYDLVRRAVRDELRDSAAPARAAEPDMVKLAHVKRYVQVSASTLKKWIKDGTLPAYGKGRLVLVKLADVRARMKRRGAPAAVPEGQAGAIVASLPRRRAS